MDDVWIGMDGWLQAEFHVPSAPMKRLAGLLQLL